MAFRTQPNARPGPYQARAPPQPNPQFGQCAGCGGGKYLYQPKSGTRAGRSFIVCCKPFEERQGACQTLEEVNMDTGRPAPQMQADANYGGWSQVPAPPAPAAAPAASYPMAPDFMSALHAYSEQNQEIVTHLAENVRLLTQIVEELRPKQ